MFRKISVKFKDFAAEIAEIFTLVDPRVHRLAHQRPLPVRVQTGAGVLVVGHKLVEIFLDLHRVTFLNVSLQGQGLPVEFLAAALYLANVNFLGGVERAKLLGVVVQSHHVDCSNVTSEVRPELEVCIAKFADKSAHIEPLNPFPVVVHHQLVVVVLQADPVGLGEVLVDGEVVTEDADAADLTGVPGTGHQGGPVLTVVLSHSQPVASLDVETDFVLNIRKYYVYSHLSKTVEALL